MIKCSLVWGYINFKYVQHPIPKFYSVMLLDVEQNGKSSKANVTLSICVIVKVLTGT